MTGLGKSSNMLCLDSYSVTALSPRSTMQLFSLRTKKTLAVYGFQGPLSLEGAVIGLKWFKGTDDALDAYNQRVRFNTDLNLP